MAVVSSYYSTFALLIAMGMTIVISIGLIVFALQVCVCMGLHAATPSSNQASLYAWCTNTHATHTQTKIDFTLIGGGLFIALMVLIMFSFLQVSSPATATAATAAAL